MGIGDRIQNLRKARGISQEELAVKAGVSRQAVSKWESGQSTPDIEKVIFLSDYFGTTTDYLLKGITPAKECEQKRNAVLFSITGTIVNAAGLVSAVFIWIERQISAAAGIVIIIMLLGTGIFWAGQVIDSRDKEKAKYFFALPNVWILPFIPMACCFNIADGLIGGFSGMIAPVPMPGNSFLTYILYWIIYISACITAFIRISKRKY